MCYRRILRRGRRVPESGPISDGAACAKGKCVRAGVRAGVLGEELIMPPWRKEGPFFFFPFPPMSLSLVFSVLSLSARSARP